MAFAQYLYFSFVLWGVFFRTRDVPYERMSNLRVCVYCYVILSWEGGVGGECGHRMGVKGCTHRALVEIYMGGLFSFSSILLLFFFFLHVFRLLFLVPSCRTMRLAFPLCTFHKYCRPIYDKRVVS